LHSVFICFFVAMCLWPIGPQFVYFGGLGGCGGGGGRVGSEGESQGSEGNLSSAALGPGDVVGRLTRAMQIMQREEDEIDVPEVPTPGPRIRGPNMW